MASNISWIAHEERDQHGDCAGTGQWQGRVYHISRLATGNWYCTKTYNGETTMLTPPGGVHRGNAAWKAARVDVLSA